MVKLSERNVSSISKETDILPFI
ncbi:MAG: hypothetical protein H6P98_1102, partial [Candidatus Aminicenantes bacterium]|nr:hypothetical protein [Candidatus Aminicenantes bacterium]